MSLKKTVLPFLLAALLPAVTMAEDPAKPMPNQGLLTQIDKNGCLAYEPGVVMLKGRVMHLLSAWKLQLEQPICINGHDDSPAIYPKQEDVHDVQIMIRKSDPEDIYNDFAHKDVVVTGSLHYEGVGSRGIVVVMISNIEAVNKDGK
jgi:hypothetical protein